MSRFFKRIRKQVKNLCLRIKKWGYKRKEIAVAMWLLLPVVLYYVAAAFNQLSFLLSFTFLLTYLYLFSYSILFFSPLCLDNATFNNFLVLPTTFNYHTLNFYLVTHKLSNQLIFHVQKLVFGHPVVLSACVKPITHTLLTNVIMCYLFSGFASHLTWIYFSAIMSLGGPCQDYWPSGRCNHSVWKF